MTTQYVRGTTLKFSATFTDEAGASMTPVTATLRLAYYISGTITTTSLAMTIAGSTATKTWDSGAADAGDVDWFVIATGTSEPAAEGTFELTANDANPSP